MIKRIFLYMALMMSLAACSDDIFNSPTEELPSDGKLAITLNVPEMETAVTRSEPSDKLADSEVQMLVFDGSSNSSTLGQIEDITSLLSAAKSANKSTITVTIDESLRHNSGLYFYFIANTDLAFSTGATTIADLKKIEGEQLVKDGNYVLSGGCTLQSLLKNDQVNLFHNAAKITVKSDSKTDPIDYVFDVFGTASSNSVVAGAETILASSTTPDLPDAITETPGVKLLFPTKNTTKPDIKQSFIIVKADYKASEDADPVPGYYRLDFINTDGELLDIKPNCYYQVTINGDPVSPGYSTPAEAAENPVSMSSGWATIHDHSPKIMNMVSDGTHELGVMAKLKPAENSTEGKLYVKVYSAENATEENDFPIGQNLTGDNLKKLQELVTFSDSWVEATGCKKLSDTERADFDKPSHQYGDEPDTNTKGTIYEITVKFSGSNTGKLTSTGSVNWRGLSRSFEVEWERKFNADLIYKSATFTSTGTNAFGDTDYFAMISSDPEDAGHANKVQGLRAEDNNGEARDAGLHFPMPYGEGNTKATYSYTITLQDLAPLLTSGYDWEARFEGDGAILTYVTIDINGQTGLKASDYTNKTGKSITGHSAHGAGPSFTLKRPGQDYEYGVGKLVFSIVGSDQEYEINLYHTGFFHKDYDGDFRINKGSATAGTSNCLTYYEVVSFGGKHWLDRNLGATSAEMYVATTGGGYYAGDVNAAGDYFRVADYNRYGKPALKAGICPPGYQIPTQEDYNEMRSSSNFSTEMTGNYNTACYAANQYNVNDKNVKQSRKMVYFPKALYLNDQDSYTGESRGGYYWTSTAASGLEKDEIGAWLRCFTLTGSATSYMNGEVYSTGNSSATTDKRKNAFNGYAMNVRCIGTDSENTTLPKKTSFFVTGATHVFLYTMSKGVPSPITTWPGTAVCSYNAVDKIYNFSYASSVNEPGDLYVIFNYKHSDGKIYSMSKNDSNNKLAKFTSTLTPNQLEGWHVDGAWVPKYENYGSEIIQDNATDTPGLWTMNVSKKNTDGTRSILAESLMEGGYGPYEGGSGQIDTKTVVLEIENYDSSKRYVAYYDPSNDRTHCHHWKSSSETTEWPGETMKTVKGDDDNTYKYVCIDNHEHIIFNNNGSNKAPNNDVGYDYQSEYVYNVNGPNSELKVIFKAKDYTKYIVKVIGTFNNWGQDEDTKKEAYCNADGIAKITSVGVGNTPGITGADNGAFRISVWDGENDYNYSYNNAVDADKKYTLSSSAEKMWINGANTTTLYDIEFNVKTKQIQATRLASGNDSNKLTIYFKNIWSKRTPIKVYLWNTQNDINIEFTTWDDSPSMTYYKKIDGIDWYKYEVEYDSSKMKWVIIYTADGWQNKVDYDMGSNLAGKVLKFVSAWNGTNDVLEFLGEGEP